MKSLLITRSVVGMMLALVLNLAHADAETLAKAKALMDQGKPQQAYQLLEPLETEQAGNPEFDYLFGIAALDSGEKTRAVFALERVLAVNPEHKQARAEIARAYFELNEKETARAEFESLKDQGVPADVQQTMDKYLAAIDQAIADEKTRISAYFDVGIGYDSNINSATDDGQFVVPGLGGLLFTLNNNGLEDASMFTRISAGVNLVHSLSDDYRFLAGASAFNNNVAGDFDTRSATLFTGLAHDYDAKNTFTVIAQGNSYRVDNEPYRNTLGGVLQWTHKIDNRSQFSFFYQGANLHYVKQEIRDAVRHNFGAGYTRVLTGKRAPVVFASIYGGRENEEAVNVDHLGHSFIGGRVGGEIKVTSRIVAYGGFSVEDRSYGGQDPLFQVARDDTRYRVAAGLRYDLADKWTLRPEVSYTNNDSNIVINDHDRYMVGVNIRRTLP